MIKSTIFMFSLFITATVCAQDQNIPSNFEKTEFELVYATSSLKSEVWAAFSKIDPDVRMANPNKPYNIGCIQFSDLPNKSLIFGGKSKTYLFIFYREVKGGPAINITNTLVIFEAKGKQVIPVWRGTIASGVVKTFPELKKALHEREFVVRQLRHNRLGIQATMNAESDCY